MLCEWFQELSSHVGEEVLVGMRLQVGCTAVQLHTCVEMDANEAAGWYYYVEYAANFGPISSDDHAFGAVPACNTT